MDVTRENFSESHLGLSFTKGSFFLNFIKGPSVSELARVWMSLERVEFKTQDCLCYGISLIELIIFASVAVIRSALCKFKVNGFRFSKDF